MAFIRCRMLWCMGIPFLQHLLIVYAAMSSDPCYFWTNSLLVNGKCYKLFSLQKTWREAQEYCEQEGESGTLAEMITEEELTTVVGMVDKEVDSSVALWTGATDVTQGGRWVWSSTKSPVPVSEWWEAIETSSWIGVELCVVMRAGFLKITACDSTEPDGFLCQRPALPVLDPCYFWEFATYVKGKCFGIFFEEKTWDAAQKFCENAVDGGTLGELLDEEERNALWDLTNLLPSSIVRMWLGATDRETEREFIWTSAQTEVIQPLWHETNPDDWSGEENCAEFLTEDGVMNDFTCDRRISFLCQVQIENPCNYFLTDSAEFYHGHCFTFFPENFSWQKASEKCGEKFYFRHLAEPATPELKKYVTDMADRSTSSARDKMVWLGGVRKDGQWKWAVAGNEITNRAFRSDINTDSFLLLDSSTGTWLSSSQGQRSFICQLELGDPCELYLPGGVFTQGRCLKFFNLSVTWSEAQEFCSEKDTILAEPETESLSDALNRYLRSMNVNTAWIGAIDKQEEGKFTWIDTAEALNFRYGADVNSATKYPFVCQTGVLTYSIHRRYTAIFPKLQLIDHQESYLQVTHGYLSFGVLLYMTVSSGTKVTLESFTRRLPPQKDLHLNLTTELALSSTGMYTRYLMVLVRAPVTVVLYIRSVNAVASTLILHQHLGKGIVFESAKSYFLISGAAGEVTENAVVITAHHKAADLNITFPVSENTEKWIQVNDIRFSPVKTIQASTTKDITTAYIKHTTNYDGAYLRASHRVGVLVTGAAIQLSGGESDLTIEHVLPVQDVSTEYVTFPSFPENITREDVFRLVATEANTSVKIYQSQAVNGVKQIYLDMAGDVKEVILPAKGFYYMKGNSHFYAYKAARGESGISSCLTSLFHTNLWRHQYDFKMTSRLDGYDVYIAAIVPAEMTSLLTMAYVNISDPVCQNTSGSHLAGCYYHLPRNQHLYYHLHLNNHMARFGAYLFATTQGSSLCHPMGLADNPFEIYNFSHDNFMASLAAAATLTCPPPVTDTTSVSYNITFQPSTISSDITARTHTTTPEITTSSITISTDSSEFSEGTTSNMAVSSPTTNASNTSSNPTLDNTQYILGQIYGSLHIDRKSTSSYKRTKISIPDGRLSSVAIGSVAIIFISLALGLIILGDLLTIMKERDIARGSDKKQ